MGLVRKQEKWILTHRFGKKVRKVDSYPESLVRKQERDEIYPIFGKKARK